MTEFEAEVVPIGGGDGKLPGFSGSPTVLVDGETPPRASTQAPRYTRRPKGPDSPTDAMLRGDRGSEAQTEAGSSHGPLFSPIHAATFG